ncbi:hypothetical protein FKM82_021033 [Ascaphus truei]
MSDSGEPSYSDRVKRVNIEEGKCRSRHLTSLINENYLKLRNK